ncbi:HipA domain-containing protein [Brucella pseudogrignonensis]
MSVTGAQEKTALLWHDGKWLKQHGTTPTTHIFKTQIGTLPNGIDLTNSVENEFYCLTLADTFGLPVNKVEIATFGKTKALVIQRFDRRVGKDRILRVPPQVGAFLMPAGKRARLAQPLHPVLHAHAGHADELFHVVRHHD